MLLYLNRFPILFSPQMLAFEALEITLARILLPLEQDNSLSIFISKDGITITPINTLFNQTYANKDVVVNINPIVKLTQYAKENRIQHIHLNGGEGEDKQILIKVMSLKHDTPFGFTTHVHRRELMVWNLSHLAANIIGCEIYTHPEGLILLCAMLLQHQTNAQTVILIKEFLQAREQYIYSNQSEDTCLNSSHLKFVETVGNDLLSKVTSASLTGRQLESLNPEIKQFKGLQSLDLSGNKLTQLPDEIDELKQLRILNLEGNCFTTVPEVLTHLDKISAIYLGRNCIKQIDKCLYGKIRQPFPSGAKWI